MNKKGRFISTGRAILGDRTPDNLEDFLAELPEKVLPGRVYQININNIKPNPYQPRQYFDLRSLEELSNSIRQKGVIQPVVLRQDEDNQIYLVAGERRLKAAVAAGLNEIPAIFTTGNPMEISLIENLQRENLKPMEEAEALQKMVDQYHYTQEQISDVIGKARSTVAEILSLNKLPEKIKQECRNSDMPRRILVEIAKQKTEKDIFRLFNRIQQDKLTGDQVRQISRPKTRSGISDITTALSQIKELKKSISKISLQDTDNKSYLRLLEELMNLKEFLEKILS